ncbi:MAG TPA: DUF1684 domain-containing protein [Flavisolibacter sp.]|jgi:hypothetical protein|nr:DUF1684 domain-containing protein [Flavisolibacter sp.]
MKTFLFLIALGSALTVRSQTSYSDSIRLYQKEYVNKHDVVKGEDRKQLHFYEPDAAFVTEARFEKTGTASWFQMATSGSVKKWYRVFGILHFQLKGKSFQLNLYQSQDLLQSPAYQNYLFLPFTDLTSGKETYASGRYMDLKMEDLAGGYLRIDFNKAYNPYCAYVSGVYNCPIPPRENTLEIAVTAGEKQFTGKH